MKNALLALSLVSVALPVAPALADPPPWAHAYGRRAHDRDRDDDRYEHHYRDYRYDRYGRYDEPVPLRYNDRIWRGGDDRYYCRRANGTTGLIIGGAVGALVGRSLDRGRDRTVGTIIGAAGGALLGREVDRGSLRCR